MHFVATSNLYLARVCVLSLLDTQDKGERILAGVKNISPPPVG